MDMDQTRQRVHALVQDGRYFIKWQHIKRRGHHVEEYEIKTVLLHGRHAPDRDRQNRYNAFGIIPPNKKIRVVYTLSEQPDGTTVVVITAFED